MLFDPLADVLSAIKNAEKAGKRETVIGRTSKVIKEVLRVMQTAGYIGDFEFVEDGRGGKFRIELRGRINDCGAIRPRFPVKKDAFKEWEKRYLPAVGVGILVVSTSKGFVSHRELKGKEGGTLIAYVY